MRLQSLFNIIYLINSRDFEGWAGEYRCRYDLPPLIRKLVRATINKENIISIRFPSGDAIQHSGVDGELKSKENSSHVPEGHSIWELSAQERIKDKFNRDYNKRTEEYKNKDANDTTFVFVTPRLWDDIKGKKIKCLEEKKKDTIWKDVRIYDSRDLEEWIHETKAISSWFAKNISKYGDKTLALEDFWREWNSNFNFDNASKLLLHNRKSETDIMGSWLSSPSGIFKIKSKSFQEATAFLCAIIETLNEDEKEYYYSRAVLVNDVAELRMIMDLKSPHFIVYSCTDLNPVKLAQSLGHNMLLTSECFNIESKYDIDLKTYDKNEFIEALSELGINTDEAVTYFDKCQGNMKGFRDLLI